MVLVACGGACEMAPRVGEPAFTDGTLGSVGAGSCPAELVGLPGMGAVVTLTVGGLGSGGVGTLTVGTVGTGGGGTLTVGTVGTDGVGTLTVGTGGSDGGGTLTVGTGGSDGVGTLTVGSNAAPACKGAAKRPKPTSNTASASARVCPALVFTCYAIPRSRDAWLTPQGANYPTRVDSCTRA
jgi:hypothetical protein